ncbi:MAG TPA: glycerol-3-phosphate 1-O-acyltransferase PlsY [Tepidisphaeraceae bacterium]|jgi:glycerol-3-phosphate acyltransferase PlsY|nr:glycerol-3-phosphate 1-O-acyltransferase PlsY [Tepidisphaeraceae bacterium]
MNGRDWIYVLIPAAYVLGSVPWGLVVGLSKGVDPRLAGSKNIGATNVGRLLGGKYFALVFVLDMLKGMVPMVLAGRALAGVAMGQVDYLLWLAVGAAAIVGHMFSLFLKFKGGKGVATSAGVALGLWPFYTWPGLVGLAVWIVLFKVTRYVSVASIVAALVFPLAYIGIGEIEHWGVFDRQLWLLVFSSLIAIMIVVRHRANIKRLREGTENRFGKKNSDKEDQNGKR